jgi:hypothetical protein
MNLLRTAAALTLTAAATFASETASAANNLVYIAGRTQYQWDGTTYGLSGYALQRVIYNSTTATLEEANSAVRQQLATWCSGGNYCIIVAYSNGMHQVAYTQANYPSALSGLLYVQSGGAAYGGSDLLDGFTGSMGSLFGAVYDPGVDTALHVSNARNAYNHHSYAAPTYSVGGDVNAYNGLWWTGASGFLPGSDDFVVSYHTAFGCVNSGSQGSGCSKWSSRTNRCKYSSGYCSNGECAGGWFSAGTDHFAMDDKAAYCF